jgi:hypothetical protein
MAHDDSHEPEREPTGRQQTSPPAAGSPGGGASPSSASIAMGSESCSNVTLRGRVLSGRAVCLAGRPQHRVSKGGRFFTAMHDWLCAKG